MVALLLDPKDSIFAVQLEQLFKNSFRIMMYIFNQCEWEMCDPQMIERVGEPNVLAVETELRD